LLKSQALGLKSSKEKRIDPKVATALPRQWGEGPSVRHLEYVTWSTLSAPQLYCLLRRFVAK